MDTTHSRRISHLIRHLRRPRFLLPEIVSSPAERRAAADHRAPDAPAEHALGGLVGVVVFQNEVVLRENMFLPLFPVGGGVEAVVIDRRAGLFISQILIQTDMQQQRGGDIAGGLHAIDKGGGAGGCPGGVTRENRLPHEAAKHKTFLP